MIPRMTGYLTLAALAALLFAAAFVVGRLTGRSEGERRGRAEARRDLEQIARDAAGQSREVARDACEKAAGKAVEQLRDAAEQERKIATQNFATAAAPLKDSIEEMKRKADQLGQDRAADHGSLTQVARELASGVREVQGSARSLRDAMRGDRQARGRWGEMQLENLVRRAGMTEHCDFDRQRRLNGSGNGGIPDLVVRFPGGGRLAVDAKAPLDAYLAAAEAGPEDPDAAERRAERLGAHAKALRGHVDTLAKRDYPKDLDGPPFTVLFLPMESLLADAEQAAPGLIHDAWAKKVVLATPTTLLGILWSAAASWRDFTSTQHADALRREALEAGNRLEKFLAHFAGVGVGLTRAADAYNAAVASGEQRLLPKLRRLRELEGGDAAGAVERPTPKPVETVPRRIFPTPAPPAPELPIAVGPPPSGPLGLTAETDPPSRRAN